MSKYHVTMDDGSTYEVEVADEADNVLDTLGKSLQLGGLGVEQTIPFLDQEKRTEDVGRLRSEVHAATENNPGLRLFSELLTGVPSMATTAPLAMARAPIAASEVLAPKLWPALKQFFASGVPLAAEGATQGLLMPHTSGGEQAWQAGVGAVVPGVLKLLNELPGGISSRVAPFFSDSANLERTAAKLHDAQTREGVNATLNSIDQYNAEPRALQLANTQHTTAALGRDNALSDRGTAGPLNEMRARAKSVYPGYFKDLEQHNGAQFRDYMFGLQDIANSPTTLDLGYLKRLPAAIGDNGGPAVMKDYAAAISDANYNMARANGAGLVDPTELLNELQSVLPTLRAPRAGRPAQPAIPPDFTASPPTLGSPAQEAVLPDRGEPTWHMYHNTIAGIKNLEHLGLDGSIPGYERIRNELEARSIKDDYEEVPLGRVREGLKNLINEASSGSYGRADLVHGANAERLQNAGAMNDITTRFFGTRSLPNLNATNPTTFRSHLDKVRVDSYEPEFGARDLLPDYQNYVESLYKEMALEPNATISRSGAQFDPHLEAAQQTREAGAGMRSGITLAAIKHMLGLKQGRTDQSMLALMAPDTYANTMRRLFGTVPAAHPSGVHAARSVAPYVRAGIVPDLEARRALLDFITPELSSIAEQQR